MEKSGLFNSENGDRLYNAKSFAKFYSLILTNGIFYNPATNLQVIVINNSMKVKIKDGFAFINGYYYENKNSLYDELTFTLPSSPNGDIIYRIILRLDSETNRLIRAFEMHSSIGENPIPPKLIRKEDVYDICLAEIRIKEGQTFIKQSDIIDTRLSEELCGIVRIPLEHLKTEEIFRQFQEWFKEQKEKLGIDLDKWQTEHKGEYIKFEKEQKKSFEDWFIKIKQILEQNPNTNLINEMDKLRKDMANLVEVYKNETYKNIEQLKEMTIGDLNANEIKLQSKKFSSNTVLEGMEELFINVDNIKSNVRRAIIDKDNKISIPSDPSTDDLVDGIKQIKVGYATGDKISYRELKEIWYYDISIKIINGNSLNKEDLLIRIKKDYIYILNLKENTLTKINKNGHVVWTKTNITATAFDTDDEYIYLANNKTLTKLSVEDGHKILEKEMDKEILSLGILEKYICICLISHWINIFDKNNFKNAGNIGISKIGTDKIEAYFYDQYRYAILDKENKKKLEIVSPSLPNNKVYEFTEPIEWIQIEDNYTKWLYFYTKEGLYSIDRSLNLKKEISNILYNTKDIIRTANEMYYTTNNIIYYQNEIGELKEVIKLDKESDIIKIFKSEENNLLILFNNGYLKKINLNNKKYIII